MNEDKHDLDEYKLYLIKKIETECPDKHKKIDETFEKINNKMFDLQVSIERINIKVGLIVSGIIFIGNYLLPFIGNILEKMVIK